MWKQLDCQLLSLVVFIWEHSEEALLAVQAGESGSTALIFLEMNI